MKESIRSIFLLLMSLFIFTGCDGSFWIIDLPQEIQAEINQEIETLMEGKKFSIKMKDDDYCLRERQIQISRGYLVGTQDLCGDTRYNQIESIDFTLTESHDDKSYFKINAGSFRDKYYHLEGLSINKKCEVYAAEFWVVGSRGSNEMVFPMPGLKLFNHTLHENRKKPEVELLWYFDPAHGQDSSARHATVESRELTEALFKKLRQKIQDAILGNDLDEDFLAIRGLKKHLKKNRARCLEN